MINIFIVDDHKLVLEGLSLMLQDVTDINVAGTFGSAVQLMEYLENHSVADVILMDVNMPEMNGIEACKILKGRYAGMKIIALTMIGEASLVKLFFKNGGNGYLHKNAGREEVIEAIRQVRNGNTFLSSEIDSLMAYTKSPAQQKTIDTPFPKLSARETQILAMIIDEKTTQEISEQLFIGFGTVETHRRNIMMKLGVKNTAGMVRIALEYGLI